MVGATQSPRLRPLRSPCRGERCCKHLTRPCGMWTLSQHGMETCCMRVFSERAEARTDARLRPYRPDEQPTQPLRINRRGRWFLSGLCLLLALVILAALLYPSALRQWFSPQAATNSAFGIYLAEIPPPESPLSHPPSHKKAHQK